MFSIIATIFIFTFGNYKNVSANSEFEATADNLGFTVNPNYQPIYINNFYHIEHSAYWENNVRVLTVSIDHVFVEDIRSDTQYAFLYRVAMDPGKAWRACGFLWLDKCYDVDVYNDDLTVTLQLRSGHNLLDYQPKNDIENYSGSMGLAAGSDGVLQLSANINWDFDDVDITVESSTGDDLFKVIHDFTTRSTYNKNESFSYGMYTFSTSDIPWVDIIYYGHFWWEGTFTYTLASFDVSKTH